MATMFTKVTGLRRGYDVSEVDEFFEFARQVYEDQTDEELSHRDIHTAVFGLTRAGYVTAEVDAALDRLENAFVARNRQVVMGQHGQQGWSAFLNRQAKTLYPRLTRAAGDRFSHPHKGRGYKASEVDQMCQDLIDFFDGKKKITAAQIRTLTFGSARGKNAYEETSVDAFMARAIEVLLGVQ